MYLSCNKSKNPTFPDIRDIFIESESICSVPQNQFYGSLRCWQSTISSAHWINLVSPGFAPYFESRFSGRRFHYFTNGIDEEFVDVHREMGLIPKTDGPLRIVYAGNIGEGQGLDYIIPQMAQEGQGSLEFVVVGDGARKLHLKAEITRLNLKNICIKPPVSRHELLEIYRGADICFYICIPMRHSIEFCLPKYSNMLRQETYFGRCYRFSKEIYFRTSCEC